MAKQISDITTKKKGDWRWVFLDKLARSASVTTACIAAGVSRFAAYNNRAKYPRFRKKWDEALEISVELLEVEARERAFDRDDPASATLTIFLLKANRPEKYRDNYQSKLESDIDVTTLSDEELKTIASGKSLS